MKLENKDFIRLHIYSFENLLRPRGGAARKESLSKTSTGEVEKDLPVLDRH